MNLGCHLKHTFQPSSYLHLHFKIRNTVHIELREIHLSVSLINPTEIHGLSLQHLSMERHYKKYK